MSASALRSAGPEFVCPNCLVPGAQAGGRCAGCNLHLELDTCALEAWEGHDTCAFVARRNDGTLVGVSPAFESCRSAVPSETPATCAARDELVAVLGELGWRRTAGREKGHWYSTRLERLIALDGPALERPPPAAPMPRSTARRRRAGTLATVIGTGGLIIAGVLAYAILAQGSNPRARLAARPTVHRVPKAPTPQPELPVSPRAVALAVTATRTSWLELRRGSKSGRILYSGELPAGQSLHVHGPRIWARFGAAANLEILADGKRVLLEGTLEHVFTAT